MDLSSILHRSLSEMAYSPAPGQFAFRLRAKAGDLREVSFLYGDTAYPAPVVKMERAKMEKTFSTSLYDYFEAEVSTPLVRLVYAFELLFMDGGRLYYYGEGFHEELSTERNDLFKFPYRFRSLGHQTPKWLSEAVFYNIFPDSFVAPGVEPSSKRNAHHGGTLLAIERSLDYILSLGCNAIYLNPVFKAMSYHRYDTEDYLQIDPSFGSEEDFARLVGKAHARGMHVILDGVFNHCGPSFFAFVDVLERQEASPYRDWFYSLSFPVKYPPEKGKRPSYATFGYEAHMPKLDLDSEEVRAYFLKVMAKWVGEFKVDGFRMDTADECSPSFWRFFSSALKKMNPEACLLAETWQNPRPMLLEEGFDGAMDYDFRRAVLAYLSPGGKSDDLLERTAYLFNRIPSAYYGGMLSLLSTHDVPRFLTLMGEDEGRMELAYILQFTYPGPVNLLYGDERGFTGLRENEYRRPMEWGGEVKFKELLHSLSSLRKAYPSLRGKGFKAIHSESGGLFAYLRSGEGKAVAVYLNASEESRMVEPLPGKVLLSKGYAEGRLASKGYLLLEPLE